MIKPGVRASGDFCGEKEAPMCFCSSPDILYVAVHCLRWFSLHRQIHMSGHISLRDAGTLTLVWLAWRLGWGWRWGLGTRWEALLCFMKLLISCCFSNLEYFILLVTTRIFKILIIDKHNQSTVLYLHLFAPGFCFQKPSVSENRLCARQN